jgi:HEPN domain-containing protein
MNKSILIQQWHIKADNDLKNARHEITFDDSATDTICFHAQQAAEKYLKSFLQWKDAAVQRTYVIGLLLEKCIEIDPEFVNLGNQEISHLTPYAVESRYLDDFYIPSYEEARDALQKAESVKNFVIDRLTFFGYPEKENSND